MGWMRGGDGSRVGTHRRPLNSASGRAARTLTRMVDGDLLSRVDLFAELEPSELAVVSSAAERRDLRRGDMLFDESDEPNELFVVVNGRIALANKSIDGRESVVALMEAGDVFGEMGLFDGLGRSTGARAIEPSEVIAIPYAPVQEVYENRPMLL